jgi:REP element-mobilizing transposase RayT
MANSYSKLYIHVVFVVKYRQAIIDKKWKDNLHAVIGNLINNEGCKTIVINGIEDHVHCLFILKPSISISTLIQRVKSLSSKWVNDQKLTNSRFEWQPGYGAFSYAQSELNNVINYIKKQEEHHKKTSFRSEYIDFLKKFEVEYNDNYLFQELE